MITVKSAIVIFLHVLVKYIEHDNTMFVIVFFCLCFDGQLVSYFCRQALTHTDTS